MENLDHTKTSVAISGVNGFVGRCLAKSLHDMDVNVIGIGHNEHPNPSIKDCLCEYCSADLSERWPNISRVDAVINLAGLAAVGASFDNPQKYIQTNTAIVTNMCEYYIANKSDKPRLVIVSSGAVYSGEQSMPISEENGILDPKSPYALSKIMNEDQAQYYRNRGLDCVVARPFNHIGIGQNKGFILPDLYDRVINLQPRETTIKTGNLETERDYTDVRDIARAYGYIALKDTLSYHLYNVCSGNSFTGKEILDTILSETDKSNISYDVDPALLRPKDINKIVGDSTRLQKDTGWRPEIDIHQTIRDFIDSKKHK